MNKLFYSALFALTVMSCETQKTVTNSQNQTTSAWDTSYGGADKSYDTELLRLREIMAPKFQTLQFHDEITGRTMTYNLFVPKNYDAKKSYPLVLFMADASTTGKGAMSPLKQGYGGFIWAMDETQKDNPSFVLVPAFDGPENVTNDQWQVSEEADMAMRLLQKITKEYSIDKNRLYTTGQSMGGMISFHFNIKYPDVFAASLFVGSQWDANILAPLAKKKFFYIISAADPKASVGMNALSEVLNTEGAKFGEVEFSAQLPIKEQNAKVNALIKEGYDINFVRFTPKTVVPESAQSWKGGEHMYSFDYAYKLKSVRDWLFKQRKN